MGNTTNKHADTDTEARKLVQDAISKHPVVIFSKTYCPYCREAKRDIAQAGTAVADFQTPKVYELNRMGALGQAVQSYLANTTGRVTVPNVFIGGKSVGGGDEIHSYATSGILKQMLAQAGPRIAALQKDREQPIGPQQAVRLVEDAIRQYPVVVFGKTYCPYCISAKRHLNAVADRVNGFNGPQVYELNEMGPLGNDIQRYLADKTGRTTVPNVFIDGKSIGGGDETAGLAASGTLERMIAAAVQPDDSFDPQTVVDQLIANHPVVMFSKTYCGFCKRAKATLAQVAPSIPNYTPPKVLELDTMDEQGAAIQEYLFQKTGQRTVPNIFVGGYHIGGSDSLQGYSQTGELIKMLTDAYNNAEVQETSATSSGTEDEQTKSDIKEIVFGAGCFWGVELAFQRVVGVVKTEVGYSNGSIPRITYEAICTGRTGAAEVVRVWYDPDVVSLQELIKVWESRHNPTSLNKQGNDTGTQYRSALYYVDKDQLDSLNEWQKEASTRYQKEIVTEILPLKNYCRAEDYHQRYLEQRGQSAAKGSTSKIRCYG